MTKGGLSSSELENLFFNEKSYEQSVTIMDNEIL